MNYFYCDNDNTPSLGHMGSLNGFMSNVNHMLWPFLSPDLKWEIFFSRLYLLSESSSVHPIWNGQRSDLASKSAQKKCESIQRQSDLFSSRSTVYPYAVSSNGHKWLFSFFLTRRKSFIHVPLNLNNRGNDTKISAAYRFRIPTFVGNADVLNVVNV